MSFRSVCSCTGEVKRKEMKGRQIPTESAFITQLFPNVTARFNSISDTSNHTGLIQSFICLLIACDHMSKHMINVRMCNGEFKLTKCCESENQQQADPE